MNIQEIKEYLETNKDNSEVQELVSSFAVEPTLEDYKNKVQTDAEFKSFMDSANDKHTSKALETWKENNLDVIVNEKVKELYPEQDPKDIEMNKLRQEIEQIRIDANKKEMTNFAFKKASELNLPTDLVEFLVSADEETTLANIERFNTSYSGTMESQLKEKLQGKGDPVPRVDTFKDVGIKNISELAEEASIRK